MTRRWAIDACKQFFALTDDDEVSIRGQQGKELLMQLWECDPGRFYEQPLQLLRQEWYHAADERYLSGGFWAALKADALVLDYGCGTGEVARLPWIGMGRRIHLADESAACVAYLRAKYAGYPHLTICHATAIRLSVAPDESYDAVVCTDVFEHLLHPLRLLRDLWRVLKPGGHALLSFATIYPHPGHLAESIAQLPDWWDWLKARANIVEVETYLWAQKPR